MKRRKRRHLFCFQISSLLANLHHSRRNFMLYKPKYCCHCGEQIERIEWFPWTSRRFCETCSAENKIYDWLPRGLVICGVAFSIFGLGAYLSSGKREAPLAVKQNRAETAKPPENPANQKTVSPVTTNVQPLVQEPAVGNQVKPLSQQPRLEPIQAENARKEIAYFCGALTKKGTPCSRKVKGGGRCWQHAGQPAMLPPEKLVASQ